MSESKSIVAAIRSNIFLGAFLWECSYSAITNIAISRNANDVTVQYGPHLNEYILKALAADKCILDGELLLWDSIAGRFEEFGSLRYFHRNEVQNAGDGDRARMLEQGDRLGKQACCTHFLTTCQRSSWM